MEDRSEVRGGQDEAGQVPSDGAGGHGRTALRLALLGLALGAGLAVASPAAAPGGPGAKAPWAAVAASAPVSEAPACQPPPGAAMVLPPGHPPIDELLARRRAAAGMPPGHPPVDLRAPVPARPLAPYFAAPEVVDL